MFKLPRCPECRTVFRYQDTKNAIKQKENECYHCHRHFRARIFPKSLVPLLIGLICCIGTNLLLLSQMKRLNLILLFVVTIGYILLIVLLIPFFTSFQKTEEKQEKERMKKN